MGKNEGIFHCCFPSVRDGVKLALGCKLFFSIYKLCDCFCPLILHMHEFVYGHGRLYMTTELHPDFYATSSRVSSSSSSNMTGVHLTILGKPLPPQNNISLSFWALFFIPITLANKLAY